MFFRIELRAIDSDGLLNTTFIDIHPNLADFTVDSEPSGLILNIDGNRRATPTTITGVRGMLRTISAEEAQISSTSVYRFMNWNDDSEGNVLSFNLDNNDEVVAEYTFETEWFEGNGNGIRGEYFLGDSLGEGISQFSRTDPTIDFNWEWSAPEGLNNDFFSIVWQGLLTPPVTAEYTFDMTADDLGRLIINQDTLIDFWAGNRDPATINLEGGEAVNIQVDFIERQWRTRVSLFWEHPYTNRQVIPSEFFSSDVINGFPDLKTNQIVLFPTIANTSIRLRVIEDTNSREIFIYDQQGTLVLRKEIGETVKEYNLDVSSLTPGMYTLSIVTADSVINEQFIKID